MASAISGDVNPGWQAYRSRPLQRHTVRSAAFRDRRLQMEEDALREALLMTAKASITGHSQAQPVPSVRTSCGVPEESPQRLQHMART
ncbi:hypothetical protein WJX75_007221 [Coccomyxa subellipsoidea]|uniref:Uncharacterized protein n=1 Tax=Coccomyxa subellipsoidea TaxID=248742 RepID=A0ABR2YW30_9CHLO